VLEMGMNHRFEIHRLSEIARPDYAVITNIGTAHLENLGSQEEIFRAKSEIFEFLKPDGKVFLNGEDNFLLRYRGRENFEFFGYNGNNNVIADKIEEIGMDGTHFRLNGSQQIFLPAPGRHMVLNALAACALGIELGLTPAQIAAGIEDFAPSGHRMSVIDAGKIRVIDDCYNASPESMKAALDVLTDAQAGRKVAILGDMFELGLDSVQFHHNVGAYAAGKEIDVIIAIGEDAKHLANAIPSALHFYSKAAFINEMEKHVQENDTVLVKASNGMGFDEIVKTLVEWGNK